jgi:hypothetical protein
MRGSWRPPAIASTQGGVFTREQAAQDGYSPYQVRRLVREGRWVQVVGDVYRTSSTVLTPMGLARASFLAAVCEAAVSHTTSGAVRDLRVPPDPDVHLTVPLDSRVRFKGVRTHRVPLADADVEVIDGVVTTTLPRTVVDLMLWLPEDQGRALVIDALQRRRIDVPTIEAQLRTVGRRHGVCRARSVLADVIGTPHSEMEMRVHRILRGAGIAGWLANAPIEDADGLVGYVDLLFPREHVVVELDGRAYHSDPDRFQLDRTRQNRLVALGYVVLRFTWDDVVHRADGVVAQVRAALTRTAA